MSQQPADYTSRYIHARKLWRASDAQRWQVAHIAYKTVGLRSLGETKKLASAIGRKEDTVERLAKAYRFFVLMITGHDSAPVRNLRRQYPYTRFATVYDAWRKHEFSFDEAIDWLENFDGGNDALSAEIENKYGDPEWQRRADGMYKLASKLRDDFGAPEKVQQAARDFCGVLDEWRKSK